MEEEVHKFVFTQKEVAEILADFIVRLGEHGVVVNPKLIIGTDIVLVSDVVE